MATVSASPAAKRSTSKLLKRLTPPIAAGLAACLVLGGVVSLGRTAEVLYSMWLTDPLKSIGMLVPAVSFVLILRTWRALRWESDGSWWGLVLLVATMLAVRFREQSVLVLILSPRWSVFFPPHSLVAFAYVVGAVLLFGGWRLLKAARFPVLLTWLVNPVPHIFNVYVDLPLQRVSAHVARAFAFALHQKLSPDQMRLMFTPQFGMFIAPGCNGIRGAVTMGMIALIVGHLYRFRWRMHLLFVAGAVLLGYLFNFVRLCTLVLFYIVALRIHWLQSRAEMGDYVLGACLFLFAVWLLFAVVRRVGRAGDASVAAAAEEIRKDGAAPRRLPVWRSMELRLAGMALFVVVAGARLAHGMMAARAAAPEPPVAAVPFPKALGEYALARSWMEGMPGGPAIYEWGAYREEGGHGAAATGNAAQVALGISPTLGSHDASICHSARGEDPVWRGELRTATAAGVESFSASFFSDGAAQSLEVTTVCNAGSCGEYSAGDEHLGLIYSRPAPAEAFSHDPKRPIPVMLKVETADTALPAELARRQLTEAATKFLTGVNLPEITGRYRQ